MDCVKSLPTPFVDPWGEGKYTYRDIDREHSFDMEPSDLNHCYINSSPLIKMVPLDEEYLQIIENHIGDMDIKVYSTNSEVFNSVIEETYIDGVPLSDYTPKFIRSTLLDRDWSGTFTCSPSEYLTLTRPRPQVVDALFYLIERSEIQVESLLEPMEPPDWDCLLQLSLSFGVRDGVRTILKLLNTPETLTGPFGIQFANRFFIYAPIADEEDLEGDSLLEMFFRNILRSYPEIFKDDTVSSSWLYPFLIDTLMSSKEHKKDPYIHDTPAFVPRVQALFRFLNSNDECRDYKFTVIPVKSLEDHPLNVPIGNIDIFPTRATKDVSVIMNVSHPALLRFRNTMVNMIEHRDRSPGIREALETFLWRISIPEGGFQRLNEVPVFGFWFVYGVDRIFRLVLLFRDDVDGRAVIGIVNRNDIDLITVKRSKLARALHDELSDSYIILPCGYPNIYSEELFETYSSQFGMIVL